VKREGVGGENCENALSSANKDVRQEGVRGGRGSSAEMLTHPGRMLLQETVRRKLSGWGGNLKGLFEGISHRGEAAAKRGF